MHGKTSMISHNKQTIFKGLKVPYHVMRYHSLIIDSSTLHKDFEIIASVQENSEEIIMAIKHNKYNLFGVQFHPESIFSEQGNKIITKLGIRLNYLDSSIPFLKDNKNKNIYFINFLLSIDKTIKNINILPNIVTKLSNTYILNKFLNNNYNKFLEIEKNFVFYILN